MPFCIVSPDGFIFIAPAGICIIALGILITSVGILIPLVPCIAPFYFIVPAYRRVYLLYIHFFFLFRFNTNAAFPLLPARSVSHFFTPFRPYFPRRSRVIVATVRVSFLLPAVFVAILRDFIAQSGGFLPIETFDDFFILVFPVEVSIGTVFPVIGVPLFSVSFFSLLFRVLFFICHLVSFFTWLLLPTLMIVKRFKNPHRHTHVFFFRNCENRNVFCPTQKRIYLSLLSFGFDPVSP
jgi:hypothetical protein